MEKNKEIIQVTIDAIVRQISLLSNRSQLESNRKTSKVNLIEYSATILQLSRTLGELIIIQRALENNLSSDKLFEMIHGRIH
jgi:hypothetical protein